MMKRIAVSTALIAAIAAAALGGWVLGRGMGPDLEAARTAGERAGWKQSTATQDDVYSAGLQTGRRITYPRTYRDAYRTTYVKAFEGSQVSAPKAEKIDVPLP
ncbi:MAG: hypothetical protein U0R51_05960 [Solirubrobacterales bacterium]